MSISPIGLRSKPTSEPEPERSEPTRAQIAATNRILSGVTRLLNDTAAAGKSHEFSITIDPATRQAVVRIVDVVTKAVVEQLPSEYLLHIAQQLSETLAQKSVSSADKTLRE